MQTIVPFEPSDSESLKLIADKILKLAKASGATAAEVSASVDFGLSVTARMREVETIEFNRDKGIGLTVYFGQKKGTATTTDTTLESLQETVDAACHIAKYTEEDDCSGLADSELMAKEIPDLNLYHPWSLEPVEAQSLALDCEGAALDFAPDSIHNSEGATLNTYQSLRIYANSHGFMGGYPTSRHSLSCSVIGKLNGSMQRDYYYTVARAAQDLESARRVGERAAERTVSRLGAKKIPTCEAPVIFVPEVARSLFGHFFSAISGSAIYRNSSFLLDSVGKTIFPKKLNLVERPLLPGALGSAPFDGEGVQTQDRDWVKKGKIQSYVLSSYSARKLGLKTTGNSGGLHNIFVSTGDKSFIELMKDMGTGLVVTELMGQGVNKVTGDYSRGAAGFWVENGELQFPVEEITIAGNLKDMFANIVEIGKDVDGRGNIQTGSVFIEKMMIAGS